MSRSSEKETDKDRLPHSPSSERNVGTNTEVAGTEPYYSVPVLQNVLSEGGVTSRLYSVQVMTQSELDYHRQHSSQNQSPSACGGGAQSSDPRHNDQDPTCDSTSGGSGGHNFSSDNSDAKSENHSRSEKPVNLSFKK